MRIAIVGAGTVGSHLAARLTDEGHAVLVLEVDPVAAAELEKRVHCRVMVANGASIQAQERAGVAASDLLIAVTSSDAVNVLACGAAARLGVERRVARVQDPTLRDGLEAQGVDLVIDPVEALARQLVLLVRHSGVSEVREFADGRIGLFGGRVQRDAPLDGITLRALRQRVTAWDWIVAAKVRDGATFIARADTMVQAGDHVLVVASGKSSAEALRLMGVSEHPARRAVILGATRLAVLTAEKFADAGIETTLVDADSEACRAFTKRRGRLEVICGDPTDTRVLEGAGVAKADVVLGLSGHDEINILGCLVAKGLGVPFAISRFRRLEYVSLLAGHGIDTGVSSRLAAANEILRLVRRGTIHSVTTFQDTEAEAIELQVGAASSSIGKTLTQVSLPKSAIVGGVIRGDTAFIPHGSTVIEAGDRLIAIVLPDAVRSLEGLFA